MPSRHWVYFGGFVLSGLALVAVALLGLFDGLSVLTGGVAYEEDLLVLAMLAEAAEWVLVGLVVGLVCVLFLAATVFSVLRNNSLPRSDRLVSLVELLERRYPVLRQFDASKRVEPTVSDRKQELKERYVAGEIDDATFEREMAKLLDDESADGDRPHSRESASIEIED